MSLGLLEQRWGNGFDSDSELHKGTSKVVPREHCKFQHDICTVRFCNLCNAGGGPLTRQPEKHKENRGAT